MEAHQIHLNFLIKLDPQKKLIKYYVISDQTIITNYFLKNIKKYVSKKSKILRHLLFFSINNLKVVAQPCHVICNQAFLQYAINNYGIAKSSDFLFPLFSSSPYQHSSVNSVNVDTNNATPMFPFSTVRASKYINFVCKCCCCCDRNIKRRSSSAWAVPSLLTYPRSTLAWNKRPRMPVC